MPQHPGVPEEVWPTNLVVLHILHTDGPTGSALEVEDNSYLVRMLTHLRHGLRDLCLLLARIAVGIVLIARGWHRWIGAGMDAQAEAVAASGLPDLGGVLIWLVLLFEILGGVMLIFGFGTRIVGLGLAILNTGIVVSKFSNGLYVHEGGYEYNLALAAVGLVFLGVSSGRLGADHLFVAGRRTNEPEPVPEAERPDPAVSAGK